MTPSQLRGLKKLSYLPNFFVRVVNGIWDDYLVSKRIGPEVGVLHVVVGHYEGVVEGELSTLESFPKNFA